MAEGLDLQRIARTLGITWNTARTYVKRILLKLDVHSQLQAVAKAGRLGMLGEKGELEDH
jgi:DNA-binding CsgD family transcriptional regulator